MSLPSHIRLSPMDQTGSVNSNNIPERITKVSERPIYRISAWDYRSWWEETNDGLRRPSGPRGFGPPPWGETVFGCEEDWDAMRVKAAPRVTASEDDDPEEGSLLTPDKPGGGDTP